VLGIEPGVERGVERPAGEAGSEGREAGAQIVGRHRQRFSTMRAGLLANPR
jgi:hypothetical protein